MIKKVFFIILTISIIGVLCYVFIGWNKHSSKKIIIEKTENSSTKESENIQISDSLEVVDKKIEKQQDLLKEEGKIIEKITPKECDTECIEFSGEKLTYCQEVCGLTPTQEKSTDCSDTSGIEQDYCLKNRAINEKDFAFCKEIYDENIKESCENRTLEEIIDTN